MAWEVVAGSFVEEAEKLAGVATFEDEDDSGGRLATAAAVAAAEALAFGAPEPIDS